MGSTCAKVCCYDTYLERQRKIEELSLQLRGLRIAVSDVTTDLIYLTNSELELNQDVDEKKRTFQTKMENINSIIVDLSQKIDSQKNEIGRRRSIDDMETLVDERGITNHLSIENEDALANERLLGK